MKLNKEAIYDEEIHPLMAQIIAICQKNGIAMIANFAVPNDEDDGVQALTHLPNEDGVFPENHTAALCSIRPPSRAPLMITTKDADGGVTMTAIL